MKGYVVRKGNQHYAVIYEGLDPLTGRERRRWHPPARIVTSLSNSRRSSLTSRCGSARRGGRA